jgi:hypothetical protein
MATLQDVSKVFRKEVGKAIYPGVPYSKYKTRSSRAFKTGNLLTKFISSPQNAINNIGSKIKGGYQFVITIAPDGAEYGRWVHYGTRKMDARPYAEIAAESKPFRDALDELMQGEVEGVVETLFDSLDNEFGKAGFKVS